MTGASWLEEAGSLSMPILITNTHAVGPCHRGVIDWVARNKPDVANQWLLPVVAETWDGYLNDINGSHVTVDHAIEAIDNAAGGAIEEGSVGGGTGMNCYAFKGGTGTASREVGFAGTTYTVGALVQANFGDRNELVVAGSPIGRDLGDDNPMEDSGWFARDLGVAATSGSLPGGAGSVIVVVATDAPLLPHQCKALARRVPLGLARTGTAGGHFSGDIFLAFSTAPAPGLRSQLYPPPTGLAEQQVLPWGAIDPFYTAVVEAVEESVLNALVVNEEMVGRDGHRTPALPHAALADLPASVTR
jgi:L-aminopeptidase/D-esterase-like protein